MGVNTPFGKLKIARKYTQYYLKSDTKHKIHSPAVFSFITEVLEKTKQSKNKLIEAERKRLLRSKQIIDFKDFGKSGSVFKRGVAEIAKSSLKSKKYAKCLSQIVKHYQCKNILELGTSLGITTAYLASNSNCKITTLEGDQSVQNIAQGIWNQLGFTSISCTVGDFDITLDSIPQQEFDLIYIDGNHKLEPTLRYFNTLLSMSHSKSIIVLDDIHYSKGMEQAWNEITKHNQSTICIDLFFLGIVFLDPSLPKQNFTLRY